MSKNNDSVSTVNDNDTTHATKRHSQNPPARTSQHPPVRNSQRPPTMNSSENTSESSHEENQVDSIIHNLDDIENQRKSLLDALRSSRQSFISKIEEIDQRLDAMEDANDRSNRTSMRSGNKGHTVRRVGSGENAEGTKKRPGRPVGSKNSSTVQRNSTAEAGSTGSMRQRQAREGGLVSYLKEVFSKSNKPMTVNEIREGLAQTEYTTSAKSPYQIIYTALTSHGNIFQKVEGERGLFKMIS